MFQYVKENMHTNLTLKHKQNLFQANIFRDIASFYNQSCVCVCVCVCVCMCICICLFLVHLFVYLHITYILKALIHSNTSTTLISVEADYSYVVIHQQALEEFSMIKDGDRVLVCLSGGKDSLSLLHSLHQYQFYSKSKVILFTVTKFTKV